MRKFFIVMLVSLMIGGLFAGCGVDEEEPEKVEEEAVEEEKINGDIGLTIDEFKNNWNNAVTSYIDALDMPDHYAPYVIDEFDVKDDQFRFPLDSGLTLNIWEHENGKIREIEIRGGKDAFEDNWWWYVEAWSFGVAALDTRGLLKDELGHERMEFLETELGVDDEKTWVNEDLEYVTDDYVLSITYYQYEETVSFSATSVD